VTHKSAPDTTFVVALVRTDQTQGRESNTAGMDNGWSIATLVPGNIGPQRRCRDTAVIVAGPYFANAFASPVCWCRQSLPRLQQCGFRRWPCR